MNIHSGDAVTRTSDDPLQEHLINARQNQILDAATQVFAAKGFHRATIRDIAKAAGVADGTIYNYFENKTALLIGILDRLNESEERDLAFAQTTRMDIVSFMRMYFKQRFKDINENGLDVFNVLFSEVLVNEDLRDTYYQQLFNPTFALADSYAQSLIKPGMEPRLDPQLALRAIAALGIGVLMMRLMGDPLLESRWDEVPDVLAELILHGIASDYGDDHATGTGSETNTDPTTDPTA
jgi:AcrR family transcriptional regulator